MGLLSGSYGSKGRAEESGNMLSFRKLQELQNKLVEAAESGYRGSIWARNYFHKSKSVECKVQTRSKVGKKEEPSLVANSSGSVLVTGGTIDNTCAGGKARSKEENYIQKNINNVNKHGEKLRIRTDTAQTQRSTNHNSSTTDLSDLNCRAERKSVGLLDTKKNPLFLRKRSDALEGITPVLSHTSSVSNSLMLSHYTSASSAFLNRTNSSSRINSTALRFFSNKSLAAKASTRDGRCSTTADMTEREANSKENALDGGKSIRIRRKEMEYPEESSAGLGKGVGLLKGKSEKRIMATKKFFERKKTVR